MKKQWLRIIPFLTVGMLILTACNLPTNGGNAPADETPIPAPNQTLTALFAITPADDVATPTLPPVVTATPVIATATQAADQPTNTPPAPVASATLAPTRIVPTATIPFARPRAQVNAAFFATPPTLDGDWSEWKDVSTEYAADALVYGKSNWTGADDLAASFHAGWDNSYLYLAIKVRDDVYVQNASGENIYKGDGIEVLFDSLLRDDYFYDQLSPDDFQLGISPGRPDVNGTKEAYLWFPRTVSGSKDGVKIASRAETGIYRVEVAIPWTLLETVPTAGNHYGFVLSVSDNDNPADNVQQSMVSSDAYRSLVDPTTWGDLQLVK